MVEIHTTYCYNHYVISAAVQKSVQDTTIWGIGAVGSAPHWQCGGQGFESPILHHIRKKRSEGPLFLCSAERDPLQEPDAVSGEAALQRHPARLRTSAAMAGRCPFPLPFSGCLPACRFCNLKNFVIFAPVFM